MTDLTELLKVLKSDIYRKSYDSNDLKWNDGNELIGLYLDSINEERTDDKINEFKELLKEELNRKEVEIKELLEYMKTEEYFNKYGGNSLNWKEGGKLMNEYLQLTDSLNIPRRNTLILEYNKILNNNLLRRSDLFRKSKN
jgi:hypothetical protein